MSPSHVVPDMTMMHDAVHGPVTLQGWHGAPDDIFVLLARSPELARLRRIKQLGLAAYAFPAADHSRYAHALGTAHVMRRLLEGRVEQQLHRIDPAALTASFPTLEDLIEPGADAAMVVAKHLLIAALVQDVGELPYAQATGRLFQAGDDIKDFVSRYTGTNGHLGGAKELFTANFVCSSPLLIDRDDVDVRFLLFLLFGDLVLGDGIGAPPDVANLRHLVDGVIDADRLDYVYRDAHHTFGHAGGPQAVVDSLSYVDEVGPVFSEPGPVLDFVSTRSSVWSRVYFEAQNRFRITLLRVILRAVRGDADAQSAFLGFASDGRLSTEDWLRVDDAFVQAGLERLSSSDEVRRSWRQTPDGRAASIALGLYLEASAAYEAEWLPPPEDAAPPPEMVRLPRDLYFDTCADYRNHRLYDRGSIRIDGPRFRRCGPPIALEECAGPLDGVLQMTWFPLAVRDSVLLFLPASRDGADWEAFERDLQLGSMHGHLMRMDEDQRLTTPDTRELREYSGPALFISYAFDDRDFVDRILAALRARRRRYYLLESPFQQTGMTAGINSVQAVEAADAVLVVLSANFKRRIADDLDGNIHKEVMEMCARWTSDGLPVVFLSADRPKVVEGAFPWGAIGLAEPPLLDALRDADDADLARWVDRVLAQIDEHAP